MRRKDPEVRSLGGPSQSLPLDASVSSSVRGISAIWKPAPLKALCCVRFNITHLDKSRHNSSLMDHVESRVSFQINPVSVCQLIDGLGFALSVYRLNR